MVHVLLDPAAKCRVLEVYLTTVLRPRLAHTSIALDNALLYEETERRALEKEVLLEISKTLSAPLDLDEVLEAIEIVARGEAIKVTIEP